LVSEFSSYHIVYTRAKRSGGPSRVPTGVTIKQEPELPIAVRFKVKGMKLHKYNDAPVGFRSEFFRWEERSGGPQDRFGLDAHLGQLVRLTEAIS